MSTNEADLDHLDIAALDGNVEFLEEVYRVNREDLSSYFLRKLSNGNFIHSAVKMNNYVLLSKAMEILPPKVVVELLCQSDEVEGSNPLHYAAKEGNIFTVKLLVNAYISSSSSLCYKGTPPWLMKNNDGSIPSHICFMTTTNNSHECAARYLVSRDQHLLKSLGEQKYPVSPDQSTTMSVDNTGASILFYAMRHGFSLLAEQILTSGLPYSLSGTDGENPLHHASKCNKKLSMLLLERHPELIVEVTRFGDTVLHTAADDNAAWLIKLMLIQDAATIGYTPRPWIKACRRLIWHINPSWFGETPLHVAARKGYTDIAKLLVQGYESSIQDEVEEWDIAEAHPCNNRLGVSPLHIENSIKKIPLIVALKEMHDELGVYLLSVTRLEEPHLNDAYEIAKKNGCIESSKEILNIAINSFGGELLRHASNVNDFHPSVLKILGHFVSRCTDPATGNMVLSEAAARLVVEGIPIFFRDSEKDTKFHLYTAAWMNADWLVEMLLEGDNSLVKDSEWAWRIACEKGQLSILHAFLAPCHEKAFIQHCRIIKDTPLHRIKLLRQEEYKSLLANPVIQEFKNDLDIGRATPLHRAVIDNNIELAKALLDDNGVELNIRDINGQTALDLLEERYNSKEWGDMCRELKLDPVFRCRNFKYLKQRTSLKDMQNTLSVVAALLATITFAAGFSVPGGVDSKDGTATLGTKAAFLAFSITNTIAMCSSLLTLFTVIGAMIWETRPNDIFLIELCVFLLQISLCGTTVAFMTGVFAIMAPKILWVGIVVIILCSLAFCGAMFAISSFWPFITMPFKMCRKKLCKLFCHLNPQNQTMKVTMQP